MEEDGVGLVGVQGAPCFVCDVEFGQDATPVQQEVVLGAE